MDHARTLQVLQQADLLLQSSEELNPPAQFVCSRTLNHEARWDICVQTERYGLWEAGKADIPDEEVRDLKHFFYLGEAVELDKREKCLATDEDKARAWENVRLVYQDRRRTPANARACPAGDRPPASDVSTNTPLNMRDLGRLTKVERLWFAVIEKHAMWGCVMAFELNNGRKTPDEHRKQAVHHREYMKQKAVLDCVRLQLGGSLAKVKLLERIGFSDRFSRQVLRQDLWLRTHRMKLLEEDREERPDLDDRVEGEDATGLEDLPHMHGKDDWVPLQRFVPEPEEATPGPAMRVILQTKYSEPSDTDVADLGRYLHKHLKINQGDDSPGFILGQRELRELVSGHDDLKITAAFSNRLEHVLKVENALIESEKQEAISRQQRTRRLRVKLDKERRVEERKEEDLRESFDQLMKEITGSGISRETRQIHSNVRVVWPDHDEQRDKAFRELPPDHVVTDSFGLYPWVGETTVIYRERPVLEVVPEDKSDEDRVIPVYRPPPEGSAEEAALANDWTGWELTPSQEAYYREAPLRHAAYLARKQREKTREQALSRRTAAPPREEVAPTESISSNTTSASVRHAAVASGNRRSPLLENDPAFWAVPAAPLLPPLRKL